MASARRLARKPKVEKRVAVTVFSFPPDKGNVGTAAYLNVFGSIFRVLAVRARGAAACLSCPLRMAQSDISKLVDVAGAAFWNLPHINKFLESAGRTRA